MTGKLLILKSRVGKLQFMNQILLSLIAEGNVYWTQPH